MSSEEGIFVFQKFVFLTAISSKWFLTQPVISASASCDSHWEGSGPWCFQWKYYGGMPFLNHWHSGQLNLIFTEWLSLKIYILSACVGFASVPELKEQLLARASQVKEIECLKQEFEQQRQQRNREHEAELEQLRLYFENKIMVAEENYKEELTLLHQRLQELKDYSLSELEMSQDQAGDIRWSVLLLFILWQHASILFFFNIKYDVSMKPIGTEHVLQLFFAYFQYYTINHQVHLT